MNKENFFDNQNDKFQITEDMVFIFGDVETTGLKSSEDKDRMTEIALIRTDHEFNFMDKYVTFINPEREISAKITELTGITEEMIEDAMIYEEAIPDIKSWWVNTNKRVIFVAHNAPFDVGFINEAFKTVLGEEIITEWIDTVSLARELYPFWKNHKLDTCANKFGVLNENHHRAENDTIVLLNIGKRLITEFIQEGLNPINFSTKKSLHYKK